MAKKLSKQAQAYIRGISGGGGDNGAYAFTGGSPHGPGGLSPEAQAYIRGQAARPSQQYYSNTTSRNTQQEAQKLNPRSSTPAAKSSSGGSSGGGKGKGQTEQQRIASILKPTTNAKKWDQEMAQVQGMLQKGHQQVENRQKGLDQQVKKKIVDPELKALEAAGVPADRAQAIADGLGGVDHPAVASPAAKAAAPSPAAVAQGQQQLQQIAATTGGVDPNDPAQAYAAATLADAGFPVNADNIRLLETQMTEEGMPGYENNALATTIPMPGSSSVNSVGVQQYPTAAEGEQADAQTLLQQNMAPIAAVLRTGTGTPQQYANALANSAYEGYDPAANAAYAQNYLADAGQPDTAFAQQGTQAGGAGGGSPLGGLTNSIGVGTTATPGLGTAGTINTSDPNSIVAAMSSLGSLLQNTVGTPFGSSLASAMAPSSTPSNLGQIGTGSTLAANTSNAPGSPDQANSQAANTAGVDVGSLQQALQTLLPMTRGGASTQGGG